jgi:hypothetical protein
MKYEIKQRLAGTKQAYWTLRVTDSSGNVVAVHTGKGAAGLGYVSGIRQRRWPDATKLAS